MQGAHHAYDDLLQARAGDLEDLDGALLCDLLRSLDELLSFHGVLGRNPHEVLRLKRGDTGIPELLPRHGDGIADGEQTGVEHADDIASVCLLHDLALRGHHGLGLTEPQFFAGLDVVILRVPLELAGADSHEGQPVPVGLVHVGLNFEYERGEIRGEHIYLALIADAGQRRCGHTEKFLQKRLHAEGGQSRTEEHGRQGSVPDSLHVKVPSSPQQLYLVPQLGGLFHPQHLVQRRVLQGYLHGVDLLALGLAGEEQDPLLFPVIHTGKFLAAADGPVDGVGVDTQFPLYLLAQLQGVAGLTVHLVDEGENGDVPQGADLEQLPGLRLHALSAIDDHDGAVSSHQGPVGVLGEVLMAGGIQNVDAEAVVLELHHGAGDGNAALFFDLHPVGGGSLGPLALDLTGLRDGAAVEQKLFRQSGLTGVRVRNDSECPPPGNFFF